MVFFLIYTYSNNVTASLGKDLPALIQSVRWTGRVVGRTSVSGTRQTVRRAARFVDASAVGCAEALCFCFARFRWGASGRLHRKTSKSNYKIFAPRFEWNILFTSRRRRRRSCFRSPKSLFFSGRRCTDRVSGEDTGDDTQLKRRSTAAHYANSFRNDPRKKHRNTVGDSSSLVLLLLLLLPPPPSPASVLCEPGFPAARAHTHARVSRSICYARAIGSISLFLSPRLFSRTTKRFSFKHE